jgi:tripartite-type tricarboxylate transporter receptor subunit TctC
MTILVRIAALFAAAAFACNAAGQGFPTRPVTLIVPFAPGGSAELIGRIVALEMGKALGHNVVVELKPGAGGNIGAELVAKNTRPDGYTMLLGSLSLATNVSLMKLNFDPRKDLAAVGGICTLPNILVVAADHPARSLQDILAAARQQPGALTFGSSGPGTSSHLSGELVKAMAGVDFSHVPYKGSGAVYPDLIAGRVTMLFDLMASALGQVKGGKVKPLATTASKRSASWPEVPTIAESGIPGFELGTWLGLFVPADTPKDAIARLEDAVLKAIQAAPVRERFAQIAAEPIPSRTAEFAKYFNDDVERFARLVREGKIKPTF